MARLETLIAAHPIRKKPYNSIKFARIDGCGTPLYRIAGGAREVGAAEALRSAFERFGAHCFHCGAWMAPQPFSAACTRDHLRPKKDGGRDHLHNLVLACGPCNRRKGGADLISFSVEKASEYMRALEVHLAGCVAALAREERADVK